MLENMKKPSDFEDGMLTKLFRNIITSTGIINNIGSYMNAYVRKGGKKPKSQITKLILDEGMTWKSFIFLIFEVLRVVRIDITLNLHYENGEVSEHRMEFYSPKYIRAKEKQKQKKLKEKNGPSKAERCNQTYI